MSTAEIKMMSNRERLATMEQLWDALCQEAPEPTSPAWHEAVLQQRREQLNSPHARFLTLDQLREQYR